MLAMLKSTVGVGIITFLLIGVSEIFHAQAQPAFNADSAYQLDMVPTNGTFFSIQGDYPPLPYDPFPLLPVYSDGTPGNYWFDDLTYDRMTSGRSFSADDVPSPPSGGTNDSGS